MDSLPPKPEDYWSKFSGKTRYTLRTKAKKLGGSVICYRGREDVASFLGKAQQTSRNTWQTKRLGLQIRNTPEEKLYWEAVASHGAMRSYILERGGSPVAFLLGTQWKGSFVYEEVGYDLALAHYSPGRVLLFHVLEDLIARDTPSLFDFGFGAADYKSLFANHRTMSGPLMLLRSCPRSRLAVALDRLRSNLSRGLRGGLERLGVLSHFRRLYRK